MLGFNHTRKDLEDFLENEQIGTNYWLQANCKLFKVMDLIRSQGVDYKELFLCLYQDMVHREVKRFERLVWFNGLKKGVDASKRKGYSARLGDFSVLTYSIIGRTMISIYEGDECVTLITDETSMESCMGQQSFGCSVNKAFYLIDKAITLYLNGDLKFEDDDKAGMV